MILTWISWSHPHCIKLGSVRKTDIFKISGMPSFRSQPSNSRLLSNLKINTIETSKCLLGAATNTEGFAKLNIKTGFDYHTSGGTISEDGKFPSTCCWFILHVSVYCKDRLRTWAVFYTHVIFFIPRAPPRQYVCLYTTTGDRAHTLILFHSFFFLPMPWTSQWSHTLLLLHAQSWQFVR